MLRARKLSSLVRVRALVSQNLYRPLYAQIFPTLVSLSGLPAVPSEERLQGRDLTPLLTNDDNDSTSGRYAFSQYAKAFKMSTELGRKELWDTCTKCRHEDIDAQGYAVRTERWRYVEWRRWNKTSLNPSWGDPKALIARELYDHAGDDGSDFDRATPTKNMWNASSTHARICEMLSKVLETEFLSDYKK